MRIWTGGQGLERPEMRTPSGRPSEGAFRFGLRQPGCPVPTNRDLDPQLCVPAFQRVCPFGPCIILDFKEAMDMPNFNLAADSIVIVHDWQTLMGAPVSRRTWRREFRVCPFVAVMSNFVKRTIRQSKSVQTGCAQTYIVRDASCTQERLEDCPFKGWSHH